MDLSQFKDFQKALQFFDRALDRGRGEELETRRNKTTKFNLREDVETIAQKNFGPIRNEQKPIALFAELAPFFAAGFCFKIQAFPTGAKTPSRQTIRLKKVFYEGRVHDDLPKYLADREFDLQLPSPGFHRVLRGRAPAVLSEMGLDLGTFDDPSAFVFFPFSSVVYILICDRPAPWQAGVIERTHEVLQEMAIVMNGSK